MNITDQMMHPKRVLFADLDGTLIETVSGNTFPSGIWDMKLKFDVLDAIKNYGFDILVIISNQGGIESGFVDERRFCKGKMNFIQFSLEEYLCIPVEYNYCKSNDKDNVYRKPNVGMLENAVYKYMSRHGVVASKEEMLMIGDASGIPLGWSDTDLKTAENFGIDYMDVNKFVERYGTANY